MKNNLSLKPILYGRTINLRPITVADAPAMFASLSDAESMRLTGTTETFTYEQVEQFCQKISQAANRVDYAITLKDDPAYIGEAVLNEIDWEAKTADFRIALGSSAYFGKGYGTEATQLIIHHGLYTLGLERITLEVYDFNPRAQHVYKKLGFAQNNVLPNALCWEGNYHDALVMNVTKETFTPKENYG
ncbi:MAG: GNAT family N-acetyltransferase [Chloroflexota bacterium]